MGFRPRAFIERNEPSSFVAPVAFTGSSTSTNNLRLANNLNQLAKAANKGALPLSLDAEDELIATCAAVLAIRMELMKAIGYESEERS
ncbi:hypothetical protein [Roseobacter weihaiensis]|uniref:hypothetical protein n=1 Tax=Roseobacter weihaiensis TaxID=2763262 RepID=UPI001D0A49B8|nr:hypothetical protein [Roseobacter sp. H9]